MRPSQLGERSALRVYVVCSLAFEGLTLAQSATLIHEVCHLAMTGNATQRRPAKCSAHIIYAYHFRKAREGKTNQARGDMLWPEPRLGRSRRACGVMPRPEPNPWRHAHAEAGPVETCPSWNRRARGDMPLPEKLFCFTKEISLLRQRS